VLGTVIEFDEPRGLGVIEGDDGERYPFHCTRIADGTREIPAGARVEFVVMAGPGGRWEADALASVPTA
jgi:cold shock CspA family protein